MKGKERVPVPVAGPAFRGGVKFIIFYVFGSFLQPAAKIDPVQSALPPVGYPSLWGGDRRRGKTTEMRGNVRESQEINEQHGGEQVSRDVKMMRNLNIKYLVVCKMT